jgi:CheY-like chemotaxis protein
MRVLLVDDGAYAADVGRHLQGSYGYAVDYANSPTQAIGHLRKNTYDVLVVDVLYSPLLTRFDQALLAGRISATDGPFLYSCLSVLAAAEKLAKRPAIVIWTDGDNHRRLHMRYAQEHFGVRVFSDKNRFGDATAALHEAITRAVRGQLWVDERLREVGIETDSRRYLVTIDGSLFTQPEWAIIWRALALGATTHAAIQDAVHLRKYRRDFVESMAVNADNLNPMPASSRGLQFLTTFAERYQRFLLDDCIKQEYP